MAEMRLLVKDTAIYGVSSILGRFLNWCLMPFYTHMLSQPKDYGMVGELYAWTALLLVILTYGLETGFFRFANKYKNQAHIVYSTSLISLAATSLAFILVISLFLRPVSSILQYESHPDFVWMMGFTVAIDAFSALPFAWIRFQKRPLFFATVRMAMIGVNIFFNLFFLWICPLIYKHHPSLVSWFYQLDYGVGYVFLSNVISSVFGLLLMSKYWLLPKFVFNPRLFKPLMRYSLPLLVLGIAGIMNQSLDKMILKYLLGGGDQGLTQLGIYTACFKLGIVMMMFTQAFRYAYEPFVFSKHKQKNDTAAYSEAMKYFIIVSAFVFLGVMYYLDLLKLMIDKDYWVGLQVVPIVLISYIFQGITFNLSFWYKLSDKTDWGAVISIVGLLVTVIGNLVFVPLYGYVASAWSSLFCFLVMMLVSWLLGKKYFPVKYDLLSAFKYAALTLVLYFIGMKIQLDHLYLEMGLRTLLLLALALYVLFGKLKAQPLLKKYFVRGKN